jgi:hypothetical protein
VESAKQGNFIKSQPFNTQGSRLIIIVVQVGAVKIYVATISSGVRSGKKERQYETQFITKLGGKTRLGLSYFSL